MAEGVTLRRTTVAVLAAASLTGWTGPAGAEEVSGQELTTLARRAVEDPAAMKRLRQVDRVDGQPVDLARALDAPGPQATERARLLAEGGSVPPVPAVAEVARRDAAEILAQRRFHPRRFPRPLAGVLRRIGGWLRPIGKPLAGLVSSLGGGTRVLVALAVPLVVVAAVVAVRVGRRRTAANVDHARSTSAGTSARPEELERQADVAEQDGQLDRAFRLRFEAGLLRLHDAGRLRFRPSLTTGEVVRKVPSPTLLELAATLEEIVYGGRTAGPRDLDTARWGWPRVLEEARP